MNNRMRSRWVRARQQTTMFRKADFIAAAFLGLVSFMSVVLFGSDQGALDQLVATAGTVVAVVFILPAISFLWNFVWAPIRQLREDLDDLRAEVAELASMVRPEPAQLREALEDLRMEVRENIDRLSIAESRGEFWRVTEPAPHNTKWKKYRELLRLERRLSDVYERVSTAYRMQEEMLTRRSVRIFSLRGRKLRDEDNLPGVATALKEANESLDVAIQRFGPVLQAPLGRQ